ncbi:MAG: metallophosphoesterase [Spirochaetales bacterium]|nr:metallophosphoesterase [Spirochaetales bacterium]
MNCATIPFRYLTDEDMPVLPSHAISYPATEFIVFSDPHFYVPEPGGKPSLPSGRNSLGKLLGESLEIGEAALHFIRQQNAGFVLIPGDLTENGSFTEHRQCVKLLKKIRQSGKQVFVIPGNHDILKKTGAGLNSDAVTAPSQFAELYGEFGYRQALYRDENSLSYIAEPAPGLWLFALDATCYEGPAAESGNYRYGAFPMETLFWIEDMLIKAHAEKKAVIVMMHYALLEHFKLQKQFFPTYVIEDFIQVAEMLAHYKVHLVFTGHFHSQDITLKRFQRDTFIFDIETGSLITYPCPLRLVRILPSQDLEITTHHIQATQSHPVDFLLHARQQLEEAMENYFTAFLTRHEFSEQEQELLVPQLTGALLAHTMGDELPPAVILNLEGLSFWHKTMVKTRRKQIEYIWHDLIPVDNNLRINLKDGTWQALPTRQKTLLSQ